MARWFSFSLIFFLFLVNDINTMILTGQHALLRRHIGSARENRYRAQQRITHPQNHIQQRQQQSLMSPELLRARWIELYSKQNKNNGI